MSFSDSQYSIVAGSRFIFTCTISIAPGFGSSQTLETQLTTNLRFKASVLSQIIRDIPSTFHTLVLEGWMSKWIGCFFVNVTAVEENMDFVLFANILGVQKISVWIGTLMKQDLVMGSGCVNENESVTKNCWFKDRILTLTYSYFVILLSRCFFCSNHFISTIITLSLSNLDYTSFKGKVGRKEINYFPSSCDDGGWDDRTLAKHLSLHLFSHKRHIK